MKEINPINIMKKFSLFEKKWTPKIIGELNGQYVKLCKLKDDFVWHSHENVDELFMVFKGTLLIDFRDRETVKVEEGEIIIVPKGVEHKPCAENECKILVVEPRGVINTGDAGGELTINEDMWI